MSDEARKIPNADALIEWDQFLDMLRNSGRESVATLWHPTMRKCARRTTATC